MVANMRVGNMDGYYVGEPWNHRAIADGIGVTAITTQDIWKDHPEKVLGTRLDFVRRTRTPRAPSPRPSWRRAAGSTPACRTRTRWPTPSQRAYVNTSRDVIIDRILGRYQNGMGKTWDDAIT